VNFGALAASGRRPAFSDLPRGTIAAMARPATFATPRSAHGSSLQLFEQSSKRARRTIAAAEPTDADAMPTGMCTRCGMIGAGQHVDADACISELRDRLAEREPREPAAPADETELVTVLGWATRSRNGRQNRRGRQQRES
jgi:hypothetical protein